jgi:hypothetical protein
MQNNPANDNDNPGATTDRVTQLKDLWDSMSSEEQNSFGIQDF